MSDLRDQLTSAVGDRYAIGRELGHGGMATVFAATDIRHGRQVAIKVVAREDADDLAAARFAREIRIAASLVHPNIVPLFDSGASAGVAYFVMPLVSGETLRTRLVRSRQLSVSEAIDLTLDVGDALAYAHERGIVHRDIKPENVLLQGGHALVADFGVARAPVADDAARITATGLGVGTPAYMSPEQLGGESSVDGRSDQYALAMVLYESLSGEEPFHAATPQASLARKMHGEVLPLATVRPSIPARIDDVIRRALSPTPADRYPDMRTFTTALRAAGDSVVTGEPATVGRRGPVNRRRRVQLAVGTLLATVATVLVVARARRGGGVDERALAIFPLRVVAQDLREWSEGLPDLLATTLDGTPGVRIADPWALWGALRPARGAPAREPEVEEARRLARRAGVGRFVLGSLVREGTRLDVTFRLYQSRSAGPSKTIQESATEDSLTPLAQRVAVQVMDWVGDNGAARGGTMGGGGGGGRYQTRSPDAMKTYLAARAALRRGMIDSADRAIDRAIALDSTFALALLEAITIKTWAQFYRGQPFNGLIELVLRAQSMSDSLSERNRLRVQLQRALIETRGTDAVELANRLVQLDSTDFEAWNNLAYTHMVHGWQYGRGLPALVVAADRAVALDSTNALALYRRAWIAAATDDTADVRRQLARLVAVDTTTDFLRGAALGLRAIVATDDAAPALLDSISRRPPTEWISALRFLRVSRPDRVMASLGPVRENAAPGLAGQIAMQADLQMQLGVGRLGLVDSMIRAGAFEALPGVAARLALPIVAASVNGIADPMVADSTLAWLGRQVPIDSAVSWVKGPNLAWHVAWLVGAYHTSFGDTALARRWRAPLSAIRVAPSVTLREYPTALLTDLDARLAERRGDNAAALTLGGRALTLWDIHTENTFDAHPEPMMRLHLARLLATAGNTDSAARIYASLVPPTTWLGLTTARAWYELAAIAEARRDCAAAASRYALARRIFELGGPDVAAWRDRARAGEGRCGAR